MHKNELNQHTLALEEVKIDLEKKLGLKQKDLDELQVENEHLSGQLIDKNNHIDNQTKQIKLQEV